MTATLYRKEKFNQKIDAIEWTENEPDTTYAGCVVGYGCAWIVETYQINI